LNTGDAQKAVHSTGFAGSSSVDSSNRSVSSAQRLKKDASKRPMSTCIHPQ
jgi:hypothetical protein